MIRLLAALEFGAGQPGNAALRQGWSVPEPGFIWSVGTVCSLQLPMPVSPLGGLLELHVAPYVANRNTGGQPARDRRAGRIDNAPGCHGAGFVWRRRRQPGAWHTVTLAGSVAGGHALPRRVPKWTKVFWFFFAKK
jgi:hypothetical protein